MPLHVGSRSFSPRPLTTVLMLCALAGLVSLGRWQLHQADRKRALFDSFAHGADATVDIDGATPALARYQHVVAHGHYEGSRQILIDNMVAADGRAGYFVITPFALDGGGWLLVNRGWVPVGESRARLPTIDVEAAPRAIRGRLDHLPSAGISLGTPAPLAPPYPVVAAFPTRATIETLLRESGFARAGEVLLLDADQPAGYGRAWQPPGLTPLRHLGYAVQWFGLALALVVLYVVASSRPIDAGGRRP